MTPTHGRGLLLALGGVLVLAPDTLLVRLTEMDSWTLAFWRGMGIALTMMLILFWRQGYVKTRNQFGMLGRNEVLAGLCYSVSNIAFLLALGHTAVANVLALLALSPILGAVMSFFLLGENVPRRTIFALVACMIGVAVILQADLQVEGDHLLGDLLAVLAALAQATAFVFLRRSENDGQLPAMILGGCCTMLAGLVLAPVILPVDVGTVPLMSLLLVAFAVLPLSFALLGVATRFIPVAEVTMIMLLEMILGPVLVWIVIKEIVPPDTLIGGTILFITLLVHAAVPFFKRNREHTA